MPTARRERGDRPPAKTRLRRAVLEPGRDGPGSAPRGTQPSSPTPRSGKKTNGRRPSSSRHASI
eukprot:176918-Prymnesium_polylepis.1